MKLEFRDKEGRRKFTITEYMLCIGILHNVSQFKEFDKTTKSLGNDKDGYTEYSVFTCTQAFKCLFANIIDVEFAEGDYIKVIN
jgi:hypothetical protein